MWCDVLRELDCYSSAWQTFLKNWAKLWPLLFQNQTLQQECVGQAYLPPISLVLWGSALTLLCSITLTPHPSCSICGLLSHTRESGHPDLLLTPCRTLCAAWVTSPGKEVWPRFAWILGKLHHRAPDGTAVVSGSSWPGEGSNELAQRWGDAAQQEWPLQPPRQPGNGVAPLRYVFRQGLISECKKEDY